MENKEKVESGSMIYHFKDGLFSFWEGDVHGQAVVIRVREDSNPSRRWMEKGLPRGITLHEAGEAHVREWLKGHPDYELEEHG